jgi:hypothetical protein
LKHENRKYWLSLQDHIRPARKYWLSLQDHIRPAMYIDEIRRQDTNYYHGPYGLLLMPDQQDWFE